jgi:hypothetical protein
MEPTTLIVGCTLFVLFVIAVLSPRISLSFHKLSPADGKRVKLPVVDSCEGCRFFSLEGGQTVMASQPAFAQAAQHIPPWQMGRPRLVEPNPEYDDLEARMQAAGTKGDYELQSKLHEELMTMRPGTLLPPEEHIEEPMLRLQWSDFGACGRHQELRSKTDRCEDYEEKP